MARAQVTHSDDAVCITFEGDRRRPEPSTGVIRFPGGCIEVSRTSDGTYWAHISVNRADGYEKAGRVVDSRVDYKNESGRRDIPPIESAEMVEHIAIRVAKEAA